MATDLVVEACLKSGRAPPAGVAGGEEKNKVPAKQLSYSVVDAYVKLVLMLVRDDTFFSFSFFFCVFCFGFDVAVLEYIAIFTWCFVRDIFLGSDVFVW